MKVLGIDPGIRGGWAVINIPQPSAFICVPIIKGIGFLPTLPRKKKGDRLNCHAMLHLWSEHKPDLAIIEAAQSMPGQGVSSTFQYGRAMGNIEGVCAALNIPIHKITAPVWKRRAKLSKDKDRSRGKVIEMFPTWADRFKLKKDHQVAEAVLIAIYGSEGLV